VTSLSLQKSAPKQNELVIREASGQDAEAWDRFVDSHPTSSVYHRFKWRAIQADIFDNDVHYLSAWKDDDQVVGVLPLVRLRSRLFGDYIVSVPYFTYGGVLGGNEEVERLLLECACDEARRLGVSHIEFRDTRPREGWPYVRTDKAVMLLELPDNADDLWSRLGSKLRSQIRRPQKEGAAAFVGGTELLDDFYSVFSRNMRDLGTPVYGRTFFLRIMQEFSQRASLCVVKLGKQAVAAGFLMENGEAMEIPWASSLREFNRLSVNMLLYWACLERSIELRKRRFDFGRSTISSATYKFKSQWGATPHQLYWHYWLREGTPLPNLTPKNPKYELAIKLWQRLPLFIANSLGPRIVGNLP
jgi:FemAB-related protein (PEP-CTERM system-associated)